MQNSQQSEYRLSHRRLHLEPDSKPEPFSLKAEGEIGMIFQDTEGKIQGCNPTAEQILGYPIQQMINQTFSASPWQFIDQAGSIIPVESSPVLKALKTGQPCLNVVVGFHKSNGELIQLLLNSQPLFQAQETTAWAVVTTFTEITKPRETDLQNPALQTLRDHEEQFRIALDSIPNILVIYDAQRRFQFVNAEGIRRSGKSWEELIGYQDEDIFPVDLTQTYVPTLKKAIATRTIQKLEVTRTVSELGTYTTIVNYVPVLNAEGEVDQVLGITYDITDRKRFEEFLEAKNRQITNIFKSITDGFVSIDHRWRYTSINAKAEELLGKSAQELIGHNIWEVFPELIESPTYAYAHQALSQQIPIEYEEFYPLFNRWFAVRLYPSTQGLSVYFLDITERKQTEAALRESEESFRNLAESMPQIVWSANPDGAVDYYNQRWAEFSGITQTDGQGWGWQPVLHSEDQQRTLDAWQQSVQTGQIYECEHRLLRFDGEFRWYLSRGVPVRDQQGQIIKWYGTATDIHEQKHSATEREKLLAREQAARAEAETANRIKDEFLATLSHELRTPMNAIMGWASLLRTRQLNSSTIARALETIERNTKLLNQLIEDILDVSRIIQGKLCLNCYAIKLIPMIEEAIEMVRSTAINKGVEIVTIWETSTAASVFGDMNRLQQIIWNLLSNAVKFTPTGGQITVKMSVIWENSTLPMAQIQVIDTGCGISPEFLPFVFERFRQADGSTTRSHGGLGLGLAIVRHLAQMHGGQVQAESPGLGLGATFTVKLPLLEPESFKAPTTPSPASDRELVTSQVLLSGLRVLVVEDEADTRELIRVTLQEYGATVMAVETALEALELIRKSPFEVLVSDLGMPEINGYELIQRVRTLAPEVGGQIPAIALTAYASAEDRQKALDLGFEQHISKPVDPLALALMIAKIVRVVDG
ncbi:PAS/PAC sensor hybrid histidine kinase [Planktothrix serta PCC 8927]|uniref:Circadian input-output histidine kinase CikA n=1 Tax=Planktothrix serta PCC 8927 TaxID=671068 RepID=A0A7Z9BPX7_9CYAN|nr:PAS domain-containing protein [Planktothrix serta]VXD19667.1 PAS/PAC sensor hybrid histidine kinase [Planktothrix serta PCC 8927]